ncbi:MAG: signal peptidase I [Nostocales cyanobacterium]|nr:MAG: signal peptidase I [Nostocales cyanobacterium]TAF15089.1 MAG: signal peptidase I [Nostocales cyanobacterium]
MNDQENNIQENSTTTKHKNQTKWRDWRENINLIAIALGLALLIRTFIAEPRLIPSESMYPTLHIGDRLVVEKLSYHFQQPKNGDIVVFHTPPELERRGYDHNQAFIKRVIAIPGQTISVIKGKVYINNQPIPEDYIAEPANQPFPSVEVPTDQLFVMGDNRNDSNDSRYWGFLPRKNIIGRATFRFWPLNRIGLI